MPIEASFRSRVWWSMLRCFLGRNLHSQSGVRQVVGGQRGLRFTRTLHLIDLCRLPTCEDGFSYVFLDPLGLTSGLANRLISLNSLEKVNTARDEGQVGPGGWQQSPGPLGIY